LKDRQILDLIYPDLRVRMARVYTETKRVTLLDMFPTEGLRSFERQKKLYEVGRELRDGKWVKTGPVLTNARPGFSRHAYGLAVDSAFKGPDPYLERLQDRKQAEYYWDVFGRAVKAYGLVWGGDWNGNGTRDVNDFDRPHAELSYGLTLTDCLDLYENGGIAAVWATIDKIRGVEVGSEWRNLVIK
jgi:peptidoglycan L-alanyl-D-glutamate endopeptidase CwlK